jgi:uncharacterized protein YndB with AHSA1/START domain
VTEPGGNTGSVADPDALTVRRTIHIAAPVAAVWAAVTEPEHISAWFGATVLDGAGPGATGSMTFDGDPPIPLRVEAVDPERSVSYRWNNDDVGGPPDRFVEERSTLVVFTLEEAPGGTRLSVVESGFAATSDPLGNLESHRVGWDAELDGLVALLEQTP